MKDYFNLKKSKLLLFMLLAIFAGGVSPAWADELVVNESTTTTNPYIPLYGNYADTQGTRSEFILSEDLLSEMNGDITQMTFELDNTYSFSATYKVYLKIVDETEFTYENYKRSFLGIDGSTTVYEGILNGNSTTMEVPFTNSFSYSGGNLLVGFLVTTKGSYANASFKGVSGTNCALYSKTNGATTGDNVNFLPKVTFEYTASGAVSIGKPKNVTANNISVNSATISWDAVDGADSYEVSNSTDNSEPAVDGSYTSVTTNSYNLSGLTAGTAYYVYVRAKKDETYSKWSAVCSFTPGMLTINNANTTTNNYVPIYGNYMDDHSRSQFILPKASLSSLSGTQITKIVFYGTASNAAKFNNKTFDVYLSEVDGETISALSDWASLEQVYSGNLTISDGKMTITLAEGFDYSGDKNLLIGINQTDDDSDYTSTEWTGVSATGASMGGYGTSISQRNFLPQTTFYYAEQTATVKKPRSLAASEIATTTATLGWTNGGDETAWQITYSTDTDFDPDTEGIKVNADANPFTLTELTAATTYYAYVRAEKSGEYSAWSNKAEFTTLSATPVITLSTTSHNFGMVSDANAQALTLTISNTGGVALTGLSVTASDGFAVTDADGNALTATTIAASSSLVVKVKVSALGQQEGTITISGDGIEDQVVTMSGYMLDDTKILETFASASSVSRWTVASGWTFNASTGAYAGTSSRVMTSPKLSVAAGDVLALNVKLGWSGGSLIVEGLDADGNTVYEPVTYNSSNGGLTTSTYTLLTISDMPTTVAKVKLTGYYAYINVFNGFSYVNDPVLGLYSNEACTSAQASPATKNFGFAAEAQSQLYYIKNTGNGQIDLTIEQADGFTAEVADAELGEGESTALTVTMTATEGLHDGTITVTAKNHDNGAVLGTFVVNGNGAITGSKNNVVLTAFPAGWQNNNWTIYNGAARIWSSTASDLITTSLKVTEGEQLLVEAYKYYSDGDSQLSYSYSTDNGATWSDAVSLTSQLTTSYKIIAISGIPAGNVLMKFTGTYSYIRQIYGFEAVAEPILTFTASDYSFGMIDAAKTTEAYTIKNEGTATLENLSVTCDNSNFTVAVANNASSIAANSEVTFTVTLNTTVKGAQSGVVTISGDGVTTKTFNVSGYVADDTKIFTTFAALPDRWTNTGNYWSFSASGATATSSSSKLETPKIKITGGEKLAISVMQRYSGSSYYVTINGSSDNGATWTAYTKTLSNDVLNNSTYTVVELSDIPTTVNKLQLVGYYVYVNGLNGFTYDDNDPQFAMYSNEACTTAINATTATNAWGFVSEDKTATYYIKNDGTGTMNISATDAPAGFTATLGKAALGAGESTSLVISMANNAETNEGYHSGSVVLTAKDSNDNVLGTFTVTASGVVVGSKTDINFASLTEFPAGWEADGWTVTANTKATTSSYNKTLTTGTYAVAAGEKLVIAGKGNSSWSSPVLSYQYSVDGGAWTNGTSSLSFSYSSTDYQIQVIDDIPAGNVVIRFTGSYMDIQRIYGYTAVAKANIALDKTADYDFGMQTADADYVITVTNNGTAELTGLTATTTTSDYTVVVSKTTLAINETATVTVTQKFDASKGLASLSDVLTISADDIAAKTINLSGKTRDASKWYVDFASSIPSDFVEKGSWSVSSGAAYLTSSTESSLISAPITLAAGEKIQFEARNPYSGSLKVRYSLNGGISWSEYVDYSSTISTTSAFSSHEIDLGNTSEVSAIIEFNGRYYVYLDNIYGGTLNNNAPMIAVTKGSAAVQSGATEVFGTIEEEATATYTITNIGGGSLSIDEYNYSGDDVTLALTGNSSLANGESATLTISMTPAAPYGAKSGAVTITTSLGDFVINYTATTLDPDALSIDFSDGQLPAGWYNDSWTVDSQDKFIYRSNRSSDTYFMTQKLDVSGENDVLIFDAKKYGSTYASYTVLKVSYSTDRVNWTEIGDYASEMTTSFQTFSISGLAAGEYYLKFTGRYAAVDNIKGWKKVADIEHDLYVTATNVPTTLAAEYTATATVTSLRAAEEGVYAKLFFDNTEVATAEAKDIALNGSATFTMSTTEAPTENDFYLAKVVVYYSDGTVAFTTGTFNVGTFVLNDTEDFTAEKAGAYASVKVNRSFNAGWGTVVLPFNVTTSTVTEKFGEGTKLYTLSSYDSETGELTFAKDFYGRIEAGKPYLIHLPAAIEQGALTFENVTLTATKNDQTDVNGAQFKGNYDAGMSMAGKYGVSPAGKLQKGGQNSTMKAFRAYVDFDTAPARVAIVIDEGTTTGVKYVLSDSEELSTERVYNLQGQRVSVKGKGLYIVNGKKEVKK